MLTLTPVPFTLHFQRPAATSRGVLRARDVVVLRAERDGVVGWGECGVVPGLSRDDRPDYVDAVRSVCEAVNDGADPSGLDLTDLPSVAFGLEMALLDLATDGQQRLFDTPFSHGEATLPTHGLVWMDTPAGMLAQVERKVSQGCRVIKLKVGALPFEEELALLAELRQRWPAGVIELRLDANGAWQPGEALDRLQRLADLDVAFLEQPIRPGQPNEMATLCAASPIPIALDEELVAATDPAQLLATIRPQHIVLKPSLLGGFAACERWIDVAERLAVQWWINSLLESNIGLNAIAQWTSALDDNRVHGLGTGQLFTNNVLSPLRLDGCGLRIDRSARWRFDGFEQGACEPMTTASLTIGPLTYHRHDLLAPQSSSESSDNQLAALDFCRRYLSGADEFVVHTSGSTGAPKVISLRREQMAASAWATGQALGLAAGMGALVCLPVRYIAGQMMLARGLELGLAMTLVEPSADPLADLPSDANFDFTAVVPLQLETLLEQPAYRPRLDQMQAILVGGAPVSAALERRVQTLTAPVYHTYGMTETATHVALRRLNGPDASPCFNPLPGVDIDVDSRGCLRVKGPMTLDRWLQTNDLVEVAALRSPTPPLPRSPSFRWLGRYDNVINSGGVKVQVETVEAAVERAWLALELAARRFFVAGVPNERLGEVVTLVIEGYPLSSEVEAALLAETCARLERFQRPRRVDYRPQLAETATGKIDRRASLADAAGQK